MGVTATSSSPVVLFLLVGAVLVSFIGMIIMSVVVGRLNSRFPYPDDCINRDCLWEAAEIKKNMNVSADPCDDFYEYACGNFKNIHPLDGTGDRLSESVLLSRQIEENLKHMLEEPSKDPPTSYQWKMRTYFQSCIDDYMRTALGGKPLINDIKKLGGWYAFPGTFQLNDWKQVGRLNSAIESIHTLYGANPFFTISVRGDWDKRQPGQAPDTNTIQITPTTLDMGSSRRYLSNSVISQYYIKPGYKTFIQTIVSLLWKDGNLGGDLNATLDTVWNDIIFVETTLANISVNSPVIYDPSQEHKTIAYLDQNYGSVIDWFHFFNSYFAGAVIQPTTQIHVQHLAYVEAVTNFIDQLHKTDNGTRQLNNYLMWKLTYFYRSELGWDYVHANRLWAMIKYQGRVRFVGQYNWCYIELDRYLPHGLSALFISRYFKHTSYTSAQEVYSYYKVGFLQRIDGMTWMDAATRNAAKAKVSAEKDHIGYDPNFEDQTWMDQLFASLVITPDQQFANFRQIQQWHRHLMTTQIGKIPLDQWPTKLYQFSGYHDTSTNTNYFPASILQHPVYDARVPMYINFGSMGAYVADLFHQSVNYPGRYYDSSGKYVSGSSGEGWWSQSTFDAYTNNVVPCHGHIYDNATLCYTPFVIGADKEYEKADSKSCFPMKHSMSMSGRDIEESSCLDTSYKAYHDFVAAKGSEKTLPGLQHENTDQAFFLSFAQIYCFNQNDIWTWIDWNYYYRAPNNVLVNGIMSQFPAFQKAFQCSADSRMAKNVNANCPGF